MKEGIKVYTLLLVLCGTCVSVCKESSIIPTAATLCFLGVDYYTFVHYAKENGFLGPLPPVPRTVRFSIHVRTHSYLLPLLCVVVGVRWRLAKATSKCMRSCGSRREASPRS